jgi:ATP-dependent RNA helicase DeaD
MKKHTEDTEDAAAESSAQAATPPTAFTALGLSDGLAHALAELGYEEPTPIQREAIPALLAGRDVLGQAATGTGKTAAFALPILERIAALAGDERKAPSALILVPTRELAMQVAEAVHRYGKSLGVSVLPIYGGQAMQQQLRALRRGIDVAVATPGRMLDHIRRSSIDLASVHFVILDEADEMLDMGFAEDLEGILAAVPRERQTALFSATMAPRVAAIARSHLNDPVRLTIARESTAAGKTSRVREVAYVVARQHKVEALGRVLDMESPTSAIVFCRTRTEVDQLTEVLRARGYGAEPLHGGLSQEQRDRVMRRFRDGTTELLIATDVAARGLDIGHLSHVVNYDIPSAPDAYVHRVGRTGRAGRDGVAITLMEPRETRLLRSIEQVGKRKIPVESVPTVLDLRARQMELTSAGVREILERGDFRAYCASVESLANEYEVMDVAAAAMKLAADARAPKVEDVDITVRPPREEHARETRQAPREKHHARGKESRIKEPRAKEPRSAGPRGKAAVGGTRRDRPATGDFIKIYVPLGKWSGVRPGDLVGAIANEAQIDSQEIGAIDVTDKFSLVEVRERDADAIIKALGRTTIRGKKVKARRERF